MRKRIKKVSKLLLKNLGYTLSKVNTIKIVDTNGKNYLLSNFYNTLKKINFEPKHIVDIGANHGTWSREALQYFPDAYYTLLEPQEWLKESFQDILETNPKVQFYPVGAGEKRVFSFYDCRSR